jgi:hypothetical protein
VGAGADRVSTDSRGHGHVAKRARKHAQGLSARGPDAFREVGCASIAFYDTSQELLGAIRFGRAPEFKKLGLKAMLAAELRGILDMNPDVEVVYLSDGAPDHWEFFEELGEPGVQVLDFFHATEHLNAALGAVYGEASIKARQGGSDPERTRSGMRSGVHGSRAC